MNKEKEQEEKIKKINEKINDLEKHQNRMTEFNLDKYKSIKSFSDGQTFSVIPNNDHYNIRVNRGCLRYNKNLVDLNQCSGSKNQQFEIKTINNYNEYNKYLGDNKVNALSENIFYPFNIILPNNNSGKEKVCLSAEGAKIGLANCT